MAAYRKYLLDLVQRNHSVLFWFSMAFLHPSQPHTNSRKKDVGKHNMLLMDFPAQKSGQPANTSTCLNLKIFD